MQRRHLMKLFFLLIYINQLIYMYIWNYSETKQDSLGLIPSNTKVFKYTFTLQ